VTSRLVILLTAFLLLVAGVGAAFAVSADAADAHSGAGVRSATLLAAEYLSYPTSDAGTFLDRTSGTGRALVIWGDAAATATVVVPTSSAISVRARADVCDGGAAFTVSIDGKVAGRRVAESTSYQNYLFRGRWGAGRHTVAITFRNSFHDAACARRLRLDSVSFDSMSPSPTASWSAGPVSTVVTASNLVLTKGRAVKVSDATAPYSVAEGMYWDDEVDADVSAPASGLVVVQAEGTTCGGVAPLLRVRADGHTVGSVYVYSASWQDYTFSLPLPAGRHLLSLSYTNDGIVGSCDRNLLVDDVQLRSSERVPGATTTYNPFVGQRLYVNPDSVGSVYLAHKARALRTALGPITSRPSVEWLTSTSFQHTGGVKDGVNSYVAAAQSRGRLPVFALYAIPDRDCGGLSAGGFSNSASYDAWVQEIADGLMDRRAVLIIEPDALGDLDECLSPTEAQARLAMLRFAVGSLTSDHKAAVYLDAGNANWHSAGWTAKALQEAGVSGANGFVVNTAAYDDVQSEITYGQQISTEVDGKHFIVDTSRDGLATANPFSSCNAPGQALGIPPTAVTWEPRVDAYLWIKYPGSSDGSCRGGAASGVFMPQAALGLIQRSTF
jgi:endoglucanase